MSQEDLIAVGQINGVYGVKGWVKIFSHTDPRQNILSYSPWLVKIKGEWKSVEVEEGKSQQGGKSVIAKLAGIDDRDQARDVMGCDLAIRPDQLPDATDGYYWMHLIGCNVQNTEGEALGEVTGLVETGAHDVLRVEGAQGSTLIPFVMDTFILDVDIEAKSIQVDWEMEDETDDA